MIKDVFLSSTFSDFQKERDIFKKKIATKLSDKLNDSMINFVDLRWGIDTSNTDEAMKKVLRICADVINQTKPLFILMLGDYYGSLPSKEDFDVVSRLYGVSTNEIKSVTEFETMVSGIYDNNDGFYLVLKRNILNKDKYINSNYFEKNNIELLAEFKNRILKTNSIFIDYDAKINDDNSIEIIDENLFVDNVVNEMFNYLQKNFNYHDSSTGGLLYQIEHDIFNSLEEEKIKSFYGRKREINELLELIDKNKITYIDGESGIGKTSIMVKLRYLLEGKGICTSYYCGDTFSRPAYSLIINFLSTYFQANAKDIYVLLDNLPKNIMHYIFIDAINECKDDYLLKLNENLIPENVKFIISGIELKKSNYKLDKLDLNDVLTILEKKCSQRYKELPKLFFDYLNNNKDKMELLCFPIQLQFFINSIMNINENDFNKIKKEVAQNNDFIAVLASVFIDRLLNQSLDFNTNLNEILKDDKLDSRLIILITNLCLQGASLDQLELYYKNMANKELTIYDFYDFRYQMGDLYQKDFSGRYHITHALVKEYIKSYYTNDEIKAYSKIIVDTILAKDYISQDEYAEVFHQLYSSDNIDGLSKIFKALYCDKILSEEQKRNICVMALEADKYDVFAKIVENKEPLSIAFALTYLLGYIDNNSLIRIEKDVYAAYEILFKYKDDKLLKARYEEITLLLFNLYTNLTNQKAMTRLFLDNQYVIESVPSSIIVMIANNPSLRIDKDNLNNLGYNIINSLSELLNLEEYDNDKLKDFIGMTMISMKIMNNYVMEITKTFPEDVISLFLKSTIKLLNSDMVHINNKIILAIEYAYASLMIPEFKNDGIYKYLANIIGKYEAISVSNNDVYFTLMIGYYVLAMNYLDDVCFNNFLYFFNLYVEDNHTYTDILDLNLVANLMPNMIEVFSNYRFDFNILKKRFKKFIYKYDYIGDFPMAIDSALFFIHALYLAMISEDDVDDSYLMLSKLNSNIINCSAEEYISGLEWIRDVIVQFNFVDSAKANKIYELIAKKINGIMK